MSDPGYRVFQNVLQIPMQDGSDRWLESTLETEVAKLSVSPSDEWKASPCLLEDIGDVLQRATSMLSRLATGLADGSHVQLYFDRRTQEAEEDTDFSDLRYVQYLHNKHAALREIAGHLSDISTKIAKTCQESPSPPFERRVGPESPSESSSQQSTPSHPDSATSTDLHDRHHINKSPSRIISDADTQISPHRRYDGDWPEMEIYMIQLIKQLSHRGKGEHTCPLKDRCDRGGRIRVFERNSDFKEHLEKHVKMYKCTLPGCPSKQGFARKDQLERHKRKVHKMVFYDVKAEHPEVKQESVLSAG